MSTMQGAEVRMELGGLGKALAEKWWAVAIRGVLAVIFAAIAFFQPGAIQLSFVIVFAAYSFVDGLFALWAIGTASRSGMGWGLLLLEGIVNIGAAIAAIALPGLTIVVFVYLLAGWAIVTGILMLGAAFQMSEGRWWLALGGLASAAYGALLFATPGAGALVLTWWIGAYALVFGVALLMLAFRLRGLRKLG
ncbi:MAG: DUF308 domain-containing protein [Alphaproteobacteria bacterium]